MPLTISSTAIQEKNKLATDSIWYLMMEITIPGASPTVVRVVRNNEDVSWASQTWQAFPFEIDEVTDDGKGSVPRVDVRVSNVSRVMESYILAYDTYVKANGFSPITVKIFVVNSKNLASSTPEVEYWFELKQPKTNAKWATFTLGGANPYNQRFPPHRILKNHCRFIFKGTLCGYSGGETVCNKTFARCTQLSNQNRFGGFPSVGKGGINALVG